MMWRWCYLKDYSDQICWKQRAALTVWMNRLRRAFVKLRAKQIYMITCKLSFLFEFLILLQDVEEQKTAPKWPGSQRDFCTLLISEKTHGIYHDIRQTSKFSIWWRYVNIWRIALKPRSSEGILKTSMWHWHSCFKVTLRSKKYPSRVFLWSHRSLVFTCLGNSLFGEACNKARFSGGISKCISI